ncbi:MAG: histidine kinase [Chitinophagaceae bacterium]
MRAARHISLRDGLSDHRVKFIFQDSEGLIWLNTANGFQRFDGQRFETLSFDTEQRSSSLPSGIMNLGIAEDKSGLIWSVTEHEGPIAYNQNTGQITSPDLSTLRKEHLRTHDVLVTPFDQVFCSSVSGLIQINNNVAAPVKTAPGMITDPDLLNQRDMLVDVDGTIWIASSGGFLRYLPQKTEWQFYHHNPDQHPLLNLRRNIAAIQQDASGRIWFSTWQQSQRGRFLYRYDPDKLLIDSVALPQPPPKANEFYNLPDAMASDGKGRMLIATQGGLLLEYDSSLLLKKIYDRVAIGDREYQFETISSLFFDRNQHLWVGCQDGLFLVASESATSRNVLPLPAPEFPWQFHFGRLRSGPEGMILYHSLGAPLLRWNPATNFSQRHDQPYFSGKWSNYQAWLCQKKDKHYFTPWFSDAVVEFDITYGTFRPILQPGELGQLSTRGLAYKGGLLFSGKRKIIRCNDEGTKIDYCTLPDDMASLADWCADPSGKVWIIDELGQLYVLQPEQNWSFVKVTDTKLRGSVYRLGWLANHLVVGTLYQGLAIFDSNGKLIRKLTHRDGLLSNTINRIENLNGLLCIEGPVGFNFLRDVKDPELLANTELDKRHNDFLAAAHDGKQGFFFLYRNRMEYLPQLLLQQPRPLVFKFTKMASSTRRLDPARQAVLAWNDNQLQFEFAALDYLLAPSLQYRYRIGDNWIYLGNNSQLLLPRLQPGSYRLELQYRHPNGTWMEPGLSYQFRIKTPIWQQGWLYVLATLLILLPVFIYRWRKNREQKKIAKIRWQLARDLHDDVGSTLSSIGIYSSVLAGRLEGTKDVELLNEIRSKAGNSIQEMADIVWAIQPENDRLTNFVQRFRAYAVPLLESKGIDIVWTDSTSRNDVQLTMLQRRNLYLVCKEALNNSLKYANATRFVFETSIDKRSLQIKLADNGVGFDESAIDRRNGIDNMRHRMKEMGGQFILRSQPGHGCLIQLVTNI